MAKLSPYRPIFLLLTSCNHIAHLIVKGKLASYLFSTFSIASCSYFPLGTIPGPVEGVTASDS